MWWGASKWNNGGTYWHMHAYYVHRRTYNSYVTIATIHIYILRVAADREHAHAHVVAANFPLSGSLYQMITIRKFFWNNWDWWRLDKKCRTLSTSAFKKKSSTNSDFFFKRIGNSFLPRVSYSIRSKFVSNTCVWISYISPVTTCTIYSLASFVVANFATKSEYSKESQTHSVLFFSHLY